MPIILHHQYHCLDKYLSIAREVTQKYIEEVSCGFDNIDELDDRIGCAIQNAVLEAQKEIYQNFGLLDWIENG
jgi:hypothetical protein